MLSLSKHSPLGEVFDRLRLTYLLLQNYLIQAAAVLI
jgi:hypothetical protein